MICTLYSIVQRVLNALGFTLAKSRPEVDLQVALGHVGQSAYNSVWPSSEVTRMLR